MKEATIWWAENRSEEQATRWYEGFLRSLTTLEEDPQRALLARENESFPIELRELRYGLGRSKTHRAIFTIRSDRVVIYAIRHLAQDDLGADDF